MSRFSHGAPVDFSADHYGSAFGHRAAAEHAAVRAAGRECPTRTIVYCDLVRNPIQEWSKVFEWLHLPWDSSVEAFLTQSSRPAIDLRRLIGRKYNYFSVQRGQKSPLESGRQDMTKVEIREVMSIVTPHFPVEQYWPDSLS